MPHHNPKVQKAEDHVRAALADHGKKHGKKDRATITRAALRAFAVAEFKALRDAQAAGEPTLTEAISHTEASLETILDLIEAAS